jgi:hypothetical protein
VRGPLDQVARTNGPGGACLGPDKIASYSDITLTSNILHKPLLTVTPISGPSQSHSEPIQPVFIALKFTEIIILYMDLNAILSIVFGVPAMLFAAAMLYQNYRQYRTRGIIVHKAHHGQRS